MAVQKAGLLVYKIQILLFTKTSRSNPVLTILIFEVGLYYCYGFHVVHEKFHTLAVI